MITYLKRYPLSILVIAAILYLSFFKPPQTSISEIKNIDKVVHICMYGGLTVILWSEHLRQHFPLIRKHLIIGGVICPIIMSGLIEIGQATLTETRGGDWMDFLAKKEVIHQVSHSKKWRSEKALDENGNPILNSKGKQVYHASYSILQDKFYEHMQEAGFNGFSRGERGSSAENLTSLEYKIKQDEKRLSALQEKISGVEGVYADKKDAFMTFNEIDNSGKKSFTGKYTVSADDYEKLTTLAKQSYSAVSEAKKLQEENQYLTRQIWSLQSEVSRLKTALSELTEKCRPYLEALKAAPKAVKEFIDGILDRFKKQEKSILYEPISAPKTQSQEHEKCSKNKKYER